MTSGPRRTMTYERVESYMRRRCTKEAHYTSDIAKSLEATKDAVTTALKRLEREGKARKVAVGLQTSWLFVSGDAP